MKVHWLSDAVRGHHPFIVNERINRTLSYCGQRTDNLSYSTIEAEEQPLFWLWCLLRTEQGRRKGELVSERKRQVAKDPQVRLKPLSLTGVLPIWVVHSEGWATRCPWILAFSGIGRISHVTVLFVLCGGNRPPLTHYITLHLFSWRFYPKRLTAAPPGALPLGRSVRPTVRVAVQSPTMSHAYRHLQRFLPCIFQPALIFHHTKILFLNFSACSLSMAPWSLITICGAGKRKKKKK